MKGMANLLASKGFIVVTFDQRGAGRSTGRATFTGSAEVSDVVSVSRWAVENIPTSSIVLVGSSAGAPIAGSAVDSIDEIKGYVGFRLPVWDTGFSTVWKTLQDSLAVSEAETFRHGNERWLHQRKAAGGQAKNCQGKGRKALGSRSRHFEMEGPRYDDEMVVYVIEFADSLEESS